MAQRDLIVFSHLGGGFVPAGRLSLTEEGGAVAASRFSYGSKYLERPQHFEIDPVSLGLDMVMGCFLLAMVIGGQKNLRMLIIWCVAAASSLLAYRYLPENSPVVVGALAGGVLGAVWMEKKK